MKKIKITLITVFILIIIYSTLVDRNQFYSCMTSGLITGKNVSNEHVYTINLKTFGETKEEINELQIIVTDENTWNLIEEDRYYFITYEQKNNETPILGQIEHNDMFGEIYLEYFDDYTSN